jgi:hypothetical protein
MVKSFMALKIKEVLTSALTLNSDSIATALNPLKR